MKQNFFSKHIISFETKLALIVLILGISLSVAGFVELQAIAKERAYLETENYVRSQVEKIQTKLNISLDSLQRVAELYASTGHLAEPQLVALVESDRQYHGATLGLAWLDRVVQADKAQYELDVQALDDEPFHIFEQTGHGFPVEKTSDVEYFPIRTVFPSNIGEYSRGFNMASIPSRLRLLNKAKQKKRTVITQRLSIYYQNNHQYGFLAFHPLFKNNLDALDQHVGFVAGIYDFSAFFADSFEQQSTTLSFALYDGSSSSQQLLFQSGEEFEHVDSVKYSKNLHWTFPLIVADKQWVLAVFPKQVTDDTNWLPYIGLLAGSLITLLLAAYLFIALMRSRQVVKLSSDLVGTTNQLDIQRQLKQQADQANYAKSQLLRAASHDLRQPIHTLGLLVNLLKNAQTETERQQLMNKVLMALDSMNNMFSSLFEISLLDSGNVEVNKSDFLLQDYIDKLAIEYEIVCEQKGIALSVVETTAAVHTDFVLFERMLRNLLSNAVRYTQQGRIIIGCRRKQTGIRVCVIDTGIGLSATSQTKLFDEFYRDEAAQKLTDKGLGLGLTIVQKTAQLLGVKVGFDSILGKGSCFYIELPYGDAVETVETSSHIEFSVLNSTVWIIEDDADSRMSLASLLKSWDCTVSSFANSGVLKQHLTETTQQPDVIISDYQLVNETGLELVDEIRHQFEFNIATLILTGDADPTTKSHIESNNCDYMLKPAQPTDLYEWLSSHIVLKD